MAGGDPQAGLVPALGRAVAVLRPRRLLALVPALPLVPPLAQAAAAKQGRSGGHAAPHGLAAAAAAARRRLLHTDRALQRQARPPKPNVIVAVDGEHQAANYVARPRAVDAGLEGAKQLQQVDPQVARRGEGARAARPAVHRRAARGCQLAYQLRVDLVQQPRHELQCLCALVPVLLRARSLGGQAGRQQCQRRLHVRQLRLRRAQQARQAARDEARHEGGQRAAQCRRAKAGPVRWREAGPGGYAGKERGLRCPRRLKVHAQLLLGRVAQHKVAEAQGPPAGCWAQQQQGWARTRLACRCGATAALCLSAAPLQRAHRATAAAASWPHLLPMTTSTHAAWHPASMQSGLVITPMVRLPSGSTSLAIDSTLWGGRARSALAQAAAVPCVAPGAPAPAAQPRARMPSPHLPQTGKHAQAAARPPATHRLLQVLLARHHSHDDGRGAPDVRLHQAAHQRGVVGAACPGLVLRAVNDAWQVHLARGGT